MSDLSNIFFKIPMIYLAQYKNEEEETRYRLYVGISLGEEQSFDLPDSPQTLSGVDVYHVQLNGVTLNSGPTSVQTMVKSDIQANADSIEVVVSDGVITRKAKMRYDSADKGGLGGGI